MDRSHPLHHWYANLEKIADWIQCGVVAREPKGEILFANAALEKWLGYEPDELEGKRVRDLVPAELRDMADEELQSITDGNIRARLVILLRKDSTTFPALSIPQRVFDDEGRLLGAVGLIIQMGTIMTAKSVSGPDPHGLRASLHRIVTELQTVTAGIGTGVVSLGEIPLNHPSLKELSPRESEVLVRLFAGERVPTIAERLFISPHTVRNHLKSMFRKLGLSSQEELVQKVRSLIHPPED